MGGVVKGVGDFLFGKSEDAKQTGQADLLTPDQKKLLQQLTGILGQQLGQGVEPYKGTVSPGASGLQSQVFDMVGNMLSTDQKPNQTALQAIQQIMGGSQNVPGAVDVPTVDVPEFNPQDTMDWFNTSVKNPAINSWKNEIIPGIQEHFISQNAGSSGAANRAIAKSGSDLMSNLDSILGNAMYQGREAQQGRQFQAELENAAKKYAAGESAAGREYGAGQNDMARLLNIPELAIATEQQPIENLFRELGLGGSRGGIQRGITSDQLAEQFNKWLVQQPYGNPWLQQLPLALGTSAFQPIVQGPTQQTGLFQDVMAPMMGAAGMAGGFPKLFGF